MPIDLIIDFRDESELSDYISYLDNEQNPLRHEYYHETIEHANEMAVHFMGKYPEDLIDSWRPNESPEIKEYRKKSYQPTTKANADKVMNTLSKIQKSGNSSIDFNPEQPARIGKNTLENYLGNYPIYSKFSDWVFGVGLENMIIDPNAVVVFKPIIDNSNDDTSYYSPLGHIYESEKVVDKWSGYYYTIRETDCAPVEKNNQIVNEGNIYLFIDKNVIVRAKQIKFDNDLNRVYEVETLYTQEFDKVPAFELKGDVIPNSYPLMYESYASGVLPFWNKSIQLNSDLDAGYVMHMYLEKYEMQTECDNNCEYNDDKEYFVIYSNKGESCSKCRKCNGSGFITSRTPYGVTTIKREAFTGKDPIIPGMGYIDKPIGIIELDRIQ